MATLAKPGWHPQPRLGPVVPSGETIMGSAETDGGHAVPAQLPLVSTARGPTLGSVYGNFKWLLEDTS